MDTKLSLGPLFSGEQRLCRPDTAAWFAKHRDSAQNAGGLRYLTDHAPEQYLERSLWSCGPPIFCWLRHLSRDLSR
jgi:hypothetical protein